MDDVVCQGDETSLNHCIFTGWGSSDCEKNEAAGVICYDRNQTDVPPPNLTTKKRGLKLYEVLDVKRTSIRLFGGRNNQEGRVEVSNNFFFMLLIISFRARTCLPLIKNLLYSFF